MSVIVCFFLIICVFLSVVYFSRIFKEIFLKNNPNQANFIYEVL